MVEKSPSKTPSLSPTSDTTTTHTSPQNEPLNLSRKMSATTMSTSSSTDEGDSASGESPSSQTANISGSPTLSSIGNPPTPTDEPYESPAEPEPGLDPQKLLEQTRAAFRGYDSIIPENPDNLPEVPDDVAQVGMGGDSANIMDEINMQRAIMQSLGLQGDAPRPPSPRKPFCIPPAAPPNPLEPIVEISTPIPMQSPMLRTVFGNQGQQAGAQTMALVPVKNAEGQTSMQLVPCQVVRPSMEVAPTPPPNTLLPFVENPIPAHTGDGVYAGGSAQPYTLGKQYLTICFVMPWGARHYVRELHCDHTMKDLLLFLQTYLRKYNDIDWLRDIINLKMANPCRNLSKLPLKTKLRDAKLGTFPVIFVFHYQFLDRVP